MQKANEFFVQGLAPGTRRVYDGHTGRFLQFMRSHALWPIGFVQRPSEADLIAFVTYEAERGSSPDTIKGALMAIGTSFRELGFGNPCVDERGASRPLLHRVVRGIACSNGRKRPARKPLTTDKLRRILPFVEAAAGNVKDGMTYSAALCLGLYGLLRVGEFVSPSVASHDPRKNLNVRDVSFGGKGGTHEYMEVDIKQAKPDPFRRGAKIKIAANGFNSCPVAAMSQFIRIRGTDDENGPLFKLCDGSFMTRLRLQKVIKLAMTAAGFYPGDIGTHSMRIGGVNSLIKAGWAADTVKVFGRYASDAFLRYIRISDGERMRASRDMAAIGDEDTRRSLRRNRY